MYLRNRRSICLVILSVLLSGCGASAVSEYGLEEYTGIVLLGDKLEGISVEMGGARRTISKEDITRTLGVWSARRSKEEKLQRVLIEAAPGSHGLKVYRGNRLLVDRSIYLSKAQVLEIRIGEV